jgi:hypothetical protein
MWLYRDRTVRQFTVVATVSPMRSVCRVTNERDGAAYVGTSHLRGCAGILRRRALASCVVGGGLGTSIYERVKLELERWEDRRERWFFFSFFCLRDTQIIVEKMLLFPICPSSTE